MIKLQTKIEIKDIEPGISYSNKIMALGSCFVEHIGGHLAKLKYQIKLNPFGIQYNPSIIGSGLLRLLTPKPYLAEDLFEYQGLWHSFDHHGSFSGPLSGSVLDDINESLQAAHQHLQETDVVLLTLGTAWVFEDVNSGAIVNNCHKLPATAFKRRRLTLEEVVAALEEPLKMLLAKRPQLQVVMTVSPIRHLKDGAVENQLSKSTLLLAIDELKKRIPAINYFPAYELMMDELRDYRFYARDLTHPNDLAIDYIRERFEEKCLSQKENALRQKIEKLLRALEHKPIHPGTRTHKTFLEKLYLDLEALDKSYSYLNFEGEMRYLLTQIRELNL